MRSLRKFSFCVVIALTLSIILPFAASALTFTPVSGYDDNGKPIPLSLYSESVYMIDLDTKEVLVDINGEQERTPASLTKLMTACVMLDEFEGNKREMKQTYVSAGNEAFDELYGTGASTADIRPYESVNYYELLAALMLPSSCEAANIIAVNMCGSISGFCELMNEKAQSLGMVNSHFSNAHGLFADQNYSSCKDISILCSYLLEKYDVFREVVAMPSYDMEATDYHPDGTSIYNTNYLLNSGTDYYYSYAKGIKTGTLDEAGRCLASYASYDGYNYLLVTMGAPMEKTDADKALGEADPDSLYANDVVYYNCLDHIRLYEWAFNSLSLTDFINPNSEITEAKVEFGDGADYVNLKPAGGFSRLWPDTLSTDQVEKKVIVKDNIVAPVEKGDVLGELQLVYAGETIASVDLVATSKVERSQTAAKLQIAAAFPGSKEFKYAIYAIIMLVVIYTVAYAVYIQFKYMKK